MTEPLSLLSRDGRALLYSRSIFSNEDDTLPSYDDLAASLDWKQETLRMYGREIAVPRLVAYYGEREYTYSGIEHPPAPFPNVLVPLAERLADIADFEFNSVLANHYRGGRDSMGYHRDNEPEIDPSCIASVSFGATRRFKFRHVETRETVTVDLDDGALLLMMDCQNRWEHSVPKTQRVVGGRVNLTFRRMGV